MDVRTELKTHSYTDIMIEHMPMGVALFAVQDLRLLAANTIYQSFLDPCWQGGQAIGKLLTDLFPQAESTGIASIFRIAAETSTSLRVDEYALVDSERGTTYWKATLDPICDNNGQVTQLLLTTNDITAQVSARQQAEHAHTVLSQTHRKVETERKRLEVIETVARSARDSLNMESVGKAIVDAISASFDTFGVYIHTADPLQQALRLLHIRTAPGSEHASTMLRHVPYDSQLIMAKAHKGREAIIVEDLQVAVASDGTITSPHLLSLILTHGVHGYISIPLWFGDNFEGTLTAILKHPIRPDDSEVQTLVGCSMPIAAALAHSRLHAALEHQHTRLRAVVDQLPEGILLVEASDGCISYANPTAAHILGIPLTSLVGASLNHYPQAQAATHPNGRPMLPWNFAVIHTLCGKAVSSQEMTVTRPDGSTVVILSSAVPLRAENSIITGAVIVFQDITVRKSIEQQRNEFVSIASHELRTPIAAIQGFAELLQMNVSRGESLDSPLGLRAISRITEQSECLTRLIDEMLDISRIEQAQLLLHFAPHDLLRTLTNVIESQATTSRQHQLRLLLEGLEPTDTLVCRFDEKRIEQVLGNLINNAIKYSPAGGEIEIGIGPIHDTANAPYEVLIWVKDHGIGIAASEQSRIFERFYRGSTLDHAIAGLGIGLYLVKELVTRHGGRIWVESIEGVGSTFYLTLPLDQCQANLPGRETTVQRTS